MINYQGCLKKHLFVTGAVYWFVTLPLISGTLPVGNDNLNSATLIGELLPHSLLHAAELLFGVGGGLDALGHLGERLDGRGDAIDAVLADLGLGVLANLDDQAPLLHAL